MPRPSADFVERVARRIAEIRKARGFTQESLAAELSIATKNLQRLESGGQNLTLRTIAKIAAVLSVEPEVFFADSRPVGTNVIERPAAAGYGAGDQPMTRSPSPPLVAVTTSSAELTDSPEAEPPSRRRGG